VAQKEQMSKRERLKATLNGKPVDRPAFLFWGHNYDAEYSLASHVSSVLWWQRYLDMDILKVQNRASYHGEGWGLRFEYPPVKPFVGIDYGYMPPNPPVAKPEYKQLAINKPEDWTKLKKLNPSEGALGERLLALKMILTGLKEMGEDVPVIETVFDPISVASRMVGVEAGNRIDVLVDYLRKYPDEFHKGLEVITQTFKDYVHEALKVGIDGFLYATTFFASQDVLTDVEYQEFGRPYGLRVLEPMQGSFVIFHVCHSSNMLFELKDYPVKIFSWATEDKTNPSLKEAKTKLPNHTLVGGLSKEALAADSPEIAINEAKKAYQDTKGLNWICGPYCSVHPTYPVENMKAVGDYLKSLSD